MRKTKDMFGKKPCILVLFILFTVVLSSAGITAYLTDGDSADNKFTIGGNRVEITEEFDPPEELSPGVSFTKDVKVTNVGPNECFVRVLAEFTNSDMGDNCEVNWNTTDWVYHAGDGYWYYKNPVAHGDKTTSLFTTITVKDDTPMSEISDVDMLVYAESYQSYDSDNQKTFDSYEDAWVHYQVNKAARDVIAPALTVGSPVSEAQESPTVTDSAAYTVSGTVTDQSGIASVTVNGVPATVNADGTWSADIALTENVTTAVTVVATDNAGNTADKTGYVCFIP